MAVNATSRATIVNVQTNESVGGLSSNITGGTASVNVSAGKTLTVSPASGTSTYGGSLKSGSRSGSPHSGSRVYRRWSRHGSHVTRRSATRQQYGLKCRRRHAARSLLPRRERRASAVASSPTCPAPALWNWPARFRPWAQRPSPLEPMSRSKQSVRLCWFRPAINRSVASTVTATCRVSPPTGQSDSLTADHITAGSLVIGGDASSSALVTIAASDTNGDPTAASGFALAGSLTPSARFASGTLSSSSLLTLDSSSSNGVEPRRLDVWQPQPRRQRRRGPRAFGDRAPHPWQLGLLASRRASADEELGAARKLVGAACVEAAATTLFPAGQLIPGRRDSSCEVQVETPTRRVRQPGKRLW